MTIRKALIIFLLGITFFSCKTTKEDIMVASIDHTLLDTLFIAAPKPLEKDSFTLPVYRSAATKKWDLIHTDLDLRFDWDKEQVIGKATIVLNPHFYPQHSLKLDAVNFEILSVTFKNKKIKYQYDNESLIINFSSPIDASEEIALDIEYIANPSFIDKAQSDRLTTEERGLYFINAQGVGNSPKQIWTQGETSYNSRWFPTIDESNQRLSQQTSITVADSLVTLSNGLLIKSKRNLDGTRTDTWYQSLKHAPYLFMVAIGDFAVVKDTWNGKDLMYYVEPPFEKDAPMIFNHTGEMMTYFSDLLKFPYPWDKYAQIVVRDFVAGAMENTSAVTFSTAVQKSKRALIDNGNDAIVAHELFHHWFGNVVTCESWSNLTLNEGFANYSEYLWFEHKYGIDRANHHRLQELNGYLHSVNQGGTHPLIHYHYNDKEDMFDAHSYNKGGLVLHMLRHYIGDDAFFASLNKYLVDNQYTEVEADELRIAFEDVTGMDLNWFFNQWYFSEGHPELYVTYSLDSADHVLNVRVEQTQDPNIYPPIFILPTDIAIYNKDGTISYRPLLINQRVQNFEFVVDNDFICASLDGHKRLLAEIIEEKTEEEYAHVLQSKGVNYVDRKNAIYALSDSIQNDIILNKLEDPYYHIRALTIEKTGPSHLVKLKDMAMKDPHSSVRAQAISHIMKLDSSDQITFLKEIIKNDPAYPPVEEALYALYTLDKSAAITLASTLIESRPTPLDPLLLSLFCIENDQKHFPFIVKQLKHFDGFELYEVNDQLLYYFIERSPTLILEAAEVYRYFALNLVLPNFQKLISTKSLFILRTHLTNNNNPKEAEQITKWINEIMSVETDKGLLSQYRLF